MKRLNLFIYICLFYTSCLQSVTLVYNMKIRRIFNLAAHLNKEAKSRLVFSTVPIFYRRTREITDAGLLKPVQANPLTESINLFEKTNSGGALLNLRYVSGSAWVEFTTGIERETLTASGNTPINAARTGFDDIIFSGGYNFNMGNNAQIVLYGLAGFPTNRKVTLNERFNSLVGTKFFSLGFGTEFSYAFVNSLKKSLIFIFQTRLLHFFNRSWFPVLPQNAEIQPGNSIDLLFTLNYRHKKNIFEIGYNPTFLTNSGINLSSTEIRAKTLIRNSFYFSFTHFLKNLPIINKPFVFGSGFSFATAQEFNTKAFAWWLNFTLVF